MLYKFFLNRFSKEEIVKIIATGKYSIKDVFILKALDGNERILAEIFRKLFPDIKEPPLGKDGTTLNVTMFLPEPHASDE